MQTISTLDDLDTKLRECDAASKRSDRALRDVFASFRMDISRTVPEDPFSPDYMAYQMDFYRRLAMKDYRPENEVTDLDPVEGARRPFPFRSGSAALAGDHMMALGFLLKNISLPAGSKIIEFGAGWGNTSIALAQLGYRVTVVDIEKNFCEIIRRRAAQLGLDVEVRHTDFFSAEAMSQDYDGALFYECFHHCSDHIRLLQALHKALKPSGKIYLGAEPILDDFPVHWGIRTDGESLWAARTNGWLELGFRTDYFERALATTGWSGTKHSLPGHDWMSVWEVSRDDAPIHLLFDGCDERIRTVTGVREGTALDVPGEHGGFAMFGPYISLPPGKWIVRLTIDESAHPDGPAAFDICAGFGESILASADVDFGTADQGQVDLHFGLNKMAHSIEARLACPKGTQVRIKSLEFFRVQGAGGA